MTRKIVLLCFLSLNILFAQCTKETSPTPVPGTGGGANGDPQPPPDWLIPQGSVFDGGPGKDGIPSIDSPQFVNADEINYLREGDLVLGLKIGDEIRAYPHPILDWHEIINDEVAGMQLAITYCPLTGTGVAWNREVDGKLTSFGVSGLLYNTNLIPYDRATDSNWSQILLKSVNGPLIGTKIETQQLIETTWATWKEMYPNTKVLSTSTGYNRSYDRYPYGDYRTNNDKLIFPVAVEDTRIPWKERVLGVVINEKAKGYRFRKISQGGSIGTINDAFQSANIVVVGSEEKNFMVAYDRKLDDDTILNFAPVQDALPIVMTDEEGNQWDVSGTAVSGPRAGTTLKQVDSFIGFWVAWGAFYPDLPVN